MEGHYQENIQTIFANHIPHNGLISKIYKEHIA